MRESVTASWPPSQHAGTHERERAVCDECGGLHQYECCPARDGRARREPETEPCLGGHRAFVAVMELERRDTASSASSRKLGAQC